MKQLCCHYKAVARLSSLVEIQTVSARRVLGDRDVRPTLCCTGRGPTSKRDEVIVLLSLRAGWRACEIAGLSWPMVLRPDGRSADQIQVAGTIAKNGRGRLIPMHPGLRTHRAGPSSRRWRAAHRPCHQVSTRLAHAPPQHRKLVCATLRSRWPGRMLIPLCSPNLHHTRRSAWKQSLAETSRNDRNFQSAVPGWAASAMSERQVSGVHPARLDSRY